MAALVVDLRLVAWILGGFLAALTAVMLVPLGYTLIADQGALQALLLAVGWTAVAAATLMMAGHKRERRELRPREAILLVVVVWIGVCLFGALPFYFSGQYAGFTDAAFEATSGFTTTGATVISDVDGLPRSLNLWRCLSHWVGGMGIVLLGLAILPLLGRGESGLYRAEFSGAPSERLRPRVVETARSLWKIYVALTAVQFVALVFAGMDAFEALCHAFSTLGTGGFSTRTASIGAFHSPLIEYIVIVFMFLAGMSFIQHFRLWITHELRPVFRDYEVRAYLLIIVAATAVVTVVLLVRPGLEWEPAVRTALFQVTSILTTTGFVTADYASWAPLAQLILFVLMFIGGCTGSTAGGLKVARAVMMLQVVHRQFRRITEPQGVFRIRTGGSVVSEETVSGLLNLVFLAWMVLLVASLLVAATGVDVLTSVAAVVACQYNVGPGLGGVGPAENYGALHPIAKWVLTLCMIAGRLEFYTLLVVLSGEFWRR
jgi:trk system potassium uptake protein TrkH